MYSGPIVYYVKREHKEKTGYELRIHSNVPCVAFVVRVKPDPCASKPCPDGATCHIKNMNIHCKNCSHSATMTHARCRNNTKSGTSNREQERNVRPTCNSFESTSKTTSALHNDAAVDGTERPHQMEEREPAERYPEEHPTPMNSSKSASRKAAVHNDTTTTGGDGRREEVKNNTDDGALQYASGVRPPTSSFERRSNTSVDTMSYQEFCSEKQTSKPSQTIVAKNETLEHVEDEEGQHNDHDIPPPVRPKSNACAKPMLQCVDTVLFIVIVLMTWP